MSTNLNSTRLLSVLPLRTYTSHLPPWELRQILRPSRWTDLYLSVLNVTVHPSISMSGILPVSEAYLTLDWNDEYYLKLAAALSERNLISSNDISGPSTILSAILCFCARLKLGSQEGIQLLSLLDLITSFLLTYVAPYCSNLVRFRESNM